MVFFVLPAVSLALLFLLGSAFLPWVVLMDRRRAARTGRALWHKSGDQLLWLAGIMQVLFALALGADRALHGLVDKFAGEYALPLWLGLLACLGGAALCTVAALLCRRGRINAHMPLTFLAAVLGILAAVLALLLGWLFLRGGAFGVVAQGGARFGDLLQKIMELEPPLVASLYMVAGLVLGVIAALALALVWYALRRSRDDYGRDYYATVLVVRAREAALIGGILLLPLAISLLGLGPNFSSLRLPQLLPLAPNIAMIVLSLLSLSLPVAILGWHMMARAALPLRWRLVSFPSLFLLWLGWYSLLARLWL